MPDEERVDATMPDATMLDAVATRLARSSAAALEASHELLAHYADTGEASTQRAVDTLIDTASDALRALTDSFAETSRGLPAAAGRASIVQSVGASSARAGRTRDRFA